MDNSELTNSQLIEITDRFYPPRYRKAAQFFLVLFSFAYLLYNARNIPTQIQDLHIEYQFLVFAILFAVLSTFLGALAWWLLLLGFGEKVDGLQSARIHLISNLAKYIPGFIWKYAGKFFLTIKMGVPINTTAVAMILEITLLILIGFGIAVTLLPVSDLLHQVYIPINESYTPYFGVSIILIIITLPIVLKIILRRNNRSLQTFRFYPRYLIASTLSIIAGWLLIASSFWLIGIAFSQSSFDDFAAFTFILAVSFIIGLLVIFVPGGMGIREGTMVLLLNAFLAPGVSVLIATTSRVIFVFSEIFATIIFLLVARLFTAKGWTQDYVKSIF